MTGKSVKRRLWRNVHPGETVRDGDQYRLRSETQWHAVTTAHLDRVERFPSLVFRRVNGTRERRGRPALNGGAGKWLQVRVPSDTLARWRSVAGAGRLSAWVTRTLEAASREGGAE